MISKRLKKLLLAAVILVAVLAVSVPIVVMAVSKSFTAQEHVVRTDWEIDAGTVIDQSEEFQVDIAQAKLGDGLRTLQLIPQDIDEEGFTYYDLDVQQRLDGALQSLKEMSDISWTATTPLAVLNPFGTGSNGLYLYFETDMATKVTYTVHVEGGDISDFTADAADISGQEFTKTHEFQLIGLVPGETNQVTLTITGQWGKTRQIVTFTVDMPATSSGYSTRLEVEEGDSDQAQADGLFAMMRVNGYLGYGFFFDNDGVLRYEMVLEGYGLDRLLFDGNEIITCVSSSKLARIDGLGRVTQVYRLDGYDLHHDIGFGDDGEVLALAEVTGGETVEDRLLSIDLDTGAVTELVDFSQLMEPYFETTRPVGPGDDFFWQAGEWDWLHLNSVQYMTEDDSVIVSSRETSAIIKVTGLHSTPTVDWLAGDERFWEDTAYADLASPRRGTLSPSTASTAWSTTPTARRTACTTWRCTTTTTGPSTAGTSHWKWRTAWAPTCTAPGTRPARSTSTASTRTPVPMLWSPALTCPTPALCPTPLPAGTTGWSTAAWPWCSASTTAREG